MEPKIIIEEIGPEQALVAGTFLAFLVVNMLIMPIWLAALCSAAIALSGWAVLVA